MLRDGRGVDSRFYFFNCLFYRCTKADLIGGRLISARIPYSNSSVNWSRYSKPWDVVFDHPGHGIAQFVVLSLPAELPTVRATKDAKLHRFRPGHVPLDLNYSHSEIWTFKDGARVQNPKLPETVKKEFRQIMSDKACLLLAPEI